MEELVIRNYSEVIPYFRHLSENVSWFDDKEVRLDEHLGGLKIHLKGEPFDSTITTGLMRAVLGIQDAIYDAYSLYCYGTIKRLSDEERRMLELRVKIEPGSSILEVFVNEVAKAAGDRIRSMNPKHAIATVATIAIITAASVNVSKYVDAKTEIARLKDQRALVTDVQKNTSDALISALEAQSGFYRTVAKQNYTALEINDETITPTEIASMTKIVREKRPLENKVYKGQFILTDIHFEDDTIYLDVKDSTTGTIIKYVNVFKEIISEDDYKWFKDSTNRQAIDLTIVTTEKKGKIESAFLQSFKK